jgi:hypothetical protein
MTDTAPVVEPSAAPIVAPDSQTSPPDAQTPTGAHGTET